MHDGGDLLERTGAAGSAERLRRALSPRSVRHGRAPERALTVAASLARRRREAPPAPPSVGRSRPSSCPCGSTFRSFPHTGQRPAQSGRQRTWSGTSSASWSRAQAPTSSSPSTTYSERSSSSPCRVASPGTPARRSRSAGQAGARQRTHGPSSAGGEAEPEHVAARGALDHELGRRHAWRRLVGLAAEAERLERDLELLPMLLAGPQAKRAKAEAAHRLERSARGARADRVREANGQEERRAFR